MYQPSGPQPAASPAQARRLRSEAGSIGATVWRGLFAPGASVFLAALALRLAVGLALLVAWGANFPLASDDGDHYDAAARWLVAGDPIVHGPGGDSLLVPPDPAERWPAAYWLFLAAQYRLWGYQYLSAVILQAGLGALGALAGYGLARRVLPGRAALAAGYALAASSTLVYLSAALSAESLYIPLLLLGLWLAVRGVEAASGWGGPGAALAAGLAFGLAEAARPVALPVFGVAAVWLVWQLGCGRPGWPLILSLSKDERPAGAAVLGGWPGRGAGWALAALVGGFVLALAPFVLRDLAALGRVAVFTAGGPEAYQASSQGQGLASLGIDPYRTGPGLAALAALQQPWQVAEVLAREIPFRLAILFLVGGWAPLGEPLWQVLALAGLLPRAALWLLALLGAAWIARHPMPGPRVGWLLLAATLAVLAPLVLLGAAIVRYRAPADPVLIIWMVAGATALHARLWARPRTDA
ncbi:MAG: glycosyltransferase family 39 protein [Chloroflexi bacterium]|nr:glycosyltransferase family 39 protein [Chloroflexota bacterium]